MQGKRILIFFPLKMMTNFNLSSFFKCLKTLICHCKIQFLAQKGYFYNLDISLVTLKWPRYFYSRWCPRGVHGTSLKKTTFPPEFCNEICTMYVWTIKNHNSAKKFWKCYTVSKWWPNNRFLFRVISILAEIWKTTFPKEFFNEIWLKVGEHEYIYITEIKF